jgi:hypothetical protein
MTPRGNISGEAFVDSNYVQQLDEWIRQKGLKKADANLAAFLAVRDLVKAHLDEGYSATIIYKYLREGRHMDVCYDTFLKYVHRYVQPPRKGAKTKGGKPQTGREVRTQLSANLAVPETPSNAVGFKFNSVPKKEDLL